MSLLVQIKKTLPQFNLDVSFETDIGTLGVLGRSGSGKSMTLRCIAGLETPATGRIVLNDRVLFDSAKGVNLPARQRGVGFLFQNYALFPHLNVVENIRFGLKGLAKNEENQKVKEKIAAFHLTGLENRFPHQLSGGQQQRAALARATIMEPELLLLDEPFSALDNYLRSQMEEELTEVLDRYQGVTLFVSHNLVEAYRVCRNLVILDNGRKVAQGYREEIFKHPPNYVSAVVTGCRNLSTARAIDAQTVEAVDWGCSLKIVGPIPHDLTHVGIRAHHLNFVEQPDQENVFPCWLVQTSETPHRVTLYLSLNLPPGASRSYHLQAEVFKEKWDLVRERPCPWLVHLDQTRLFLTSEV